MTTEKVEGERGMKNLSDISEEIAIKLLQGWAMLESVCAICNETPLLKQKNSTLRYCARCNLFIKLESAEETITSASTSVDITNKNIEETIKNEKLSDDGNRSCFKKIKQEQKEESNGTYINTKQYDENEQGNIFFVPENKNNFETVNESTKKDKVKYIKEIKLQNGEFSDFINKNVLEQIGMTNLTDMNKYIYDKCGDCFGNYLNFEKNQQPDDKENSKNDTIEMKKVEKVNEKKEDKRAGEIGGEYQKENINNIFEMKRIHCEDKNFSESKESKNEGFIFEKAKRALLNILEKYTEELIISREKNQEVELVTKITKVVTLLEKINDLNKAFTI